MLRDRAVVTIATWTADEVSWELYALSLKTATAFLPPLFTINSQAEPILRT